MHFGPAHRDHVVHFYEDDSALREMIARYIGIGIGAGESVIVIARKERCAQVRRRLSANAIDLDGVERSNQLAFLDAEDMLDRFMIDGMPDVGRFCAYALERFSSSADVADFDALCWAHSTAVPPECVTRQRERALAGEVERRKELERELESLRGYH